MNSRGRSVVAALLVAVIAVRVSVSQPLAASVARIAADPGAALARAADGWTLAGTLGGATAQGLREVPLALFLGLGSELGLDAEVLQIAWRVLVLLLALWGATRLARAVATPDRAESWMPHVAALLFSSGIVLVSTVARSPLDGLAAATLPWIVAPLLTGTMRWGQAASSAAWLGLAGVGSPSWAVVALVAALAAALPRSRDRILPTLRFLGLAVLSCAWWVSAFAWETVHARDVSALLGREGLGEALTEVAGRADLGMPLLLLVTLGPVVVTVSALLLRPPGLDRLFLSVLGGAALVVVVAWLLGWELPVHASSSADTGTAAVAPLMGWLALTGLVAWTPLVAALGDQLRVDARWRLPSGRQGVATGLLGVLIMATTAAGATAAAAQPAESAAVGEGLGAQVARWSSTSPAGRVLVLAPEGSAVRAESLGLALGGRPWVGRDSLPLSGAAATSALDELISRLDRGDGGAGTATALRRLGIAYVMVQQGGSAAADVEPPAALVRAALAAMDGQRVALLTGEPSDGSPRSPRVLDFGVRSTTVQAEIWSLPGTAPGWVHPGPPVEVAGAAGSVADLADAGVLDGRATRLRGRSADQVDVVSDSARRRDVDQRVAADPYGPDLRANEPRSVVPPGAAPVITASRSLSGALSVSASSTAADLDGAHRRAGTDATAAIDGNAYTSWESRRGAGVGQWWQVHLPAPTELGGTSVSFVRNLFLGQRVTRARVTTDQGTTEYDVPANGLLELEGSGRGKRLRITITGMAGAPVPSGGVGIAEVSIPGVGVHAGLAVSGPATTAWVLAARPGSHISCVPPAPAQVASGESALVCDRGVTVDGPDTGSLDRVIEVDRSVAAVGGRAWVRATATEESAALASTLARATVIATGSSTAAQDLITGPQAAVDADDSTAWRPASEDAAPSLTLTWRRPADVSGVRLEPLDEAVASIPTRVRVAAETEAGRTVSHEAAAGADGLVTVPRVRTRKVTVTVLAQSALMSADSRTGGARPVPIAVAEMELVGGPEVRYDADRTQVLGCGSGPAVSIGGREVRSAVTASAREVVGGELLRADLCDDVDLEAGKVSVQVPASGSWSPLGLLLAGPAGIDDGAGTAASASQPGPLDVAMGDLSSPGKAEAVSVGDASTGRTVTLAVPAEGGWQARSSQGTLEQVTADGWSQGWAVPAGVTEVEISYAAGGSLRAWVGVGSAAWALVVLLALGLGFRTTWPRGSH